MINQDQNCHAIINEEYFKNFDKRNNVNKIKFKLSKGQKMLIEGKEEFVVNKVTAKLMKQLKEIIGVK